RVKDPETGEGDIEIRIIGKRPGEKQHEELLTSDANLTATPHEKILRAQEARLSQIEVAAMLREIEAAIAAGEPGRFRAVIERWITAPPGPAVQERS
ncbi:MAG: polysaccharide biosynthesis protein, partial [Alphaproteobacteria bacterium]